MEERSLLAVNVTFNALGPGILEIDASASDVSNTIRIYNNGNGHISGFIDDKFGDSPLGGGNGFFNVQEVAIYGGPVGAAIYYYQQGDPFNPQGDQIYGGGGGPFRGFQLSVLFAGGNNSLAVDLHGHALKAGPVDFWVAGGNVGKESVTVNATNVNIGPQVLFNVLAGGHIPAGAGNIDFSMDYSGFNSGVLQVHGNADIDAQASFRLNATFLGSPLSRFGFPGRRGTAAFGTHPGDLAFTGGDGGNDLQMLLFSPGGLSLTGDVNAGPGPSSCFRTANVKDHGCQFDRVYGRVPIRITPVLLPF
jgi:hypothetical protein